MDTTTDVPAPVSPPAESPAESPAELPAASPVASRATPPAGPPVPSPAANTAPPVGPGALPPPGPPAPPVFARGGISIGSIITGALVVGAAVVLFALIARASATYSGYHPRVLPIGGVRGTGLWVAAGSGLGVLLAFAWGGYTAGRMGRGRGSLNGLLVVIAVGILTLIGMGMASLLRPGPGLDLAFRLPAGYPKTHFILQPSVAAALGVALALAGAIFGGMFGSGWHRGLERRHTQRELEVKQARESYTDLRQALATPLEPGPLSASYQPAHTFDQEAGATT